MFAKAKLEVKHGNKGFTLFINDTEYGFYSMTDNSYASFSMALNDAKDYGCTGILFET
jgi:hypothetical protein